MNKIVELSPLPIKQLRQGLFHYYPHVIRWELSPMTGAIDFISVDQSVDNGLVNLDKLSTLIDSQQELIDQGVKKALKESIAKALQIISVPFEKNDECWIVFQGKKEDVRTSFEVLNEFGIERDLATFPIAFPYLEENEKAEDYDWEQAIWKGTWAEVNIENLIRSIANRDFLYKPYVAPEVFVIHPRKQLVVNMYDYRGIDVLANEPQFLELFTNILVDSKM